MKPAVILDCGGVLGLPQDPDREAAMAALCDLPVEKFRILYIKDRLALDRGAISVDEYWSRLFIASGITPSPALIAGIEEHDAQGWSRVNLKVVAWSRELRAAGYRTAILSNMPPNKLSFMRGTGRFDWIDEFPVALFSCEVDLVKPDPRIYRLCLERLGVEPAASVFLDDLPANVAAARALGINALLFLSPEEAAPELHERWGLPVRSLVDGAYA